MKKQTLTIVIIAVAIVAILLTDHFGIIDLRGMVKPGGEGLTASQNAINSQSGSVGGNRPDETNAAPVQTTLQQDYVGKLVASITPDQKKALLENSQAFRSFIDQEALNIAMLQAARANELESDAGIQFLVQRGADNVLREIYLSRLINTKIPTDFPNDQQIQEYYDNNKDKLKLEERLSVWQIFLPVNDTIDTNAVASEADKIADSLREGKLDFSAAALQYSRHDPSRLNGGFMGILKKSELIPEILRAINELETGEISPAVKSSMGYHIIKRGETMPVQELALEQIRGEIKGLMINQTRVQLRKAINDQVLKTYPVAVDDALIEQWRQAFLTEVK